MPAPLSYRSYAKINLYLDIVGRRPDGYHNIETLFQTISVADTLHFTEGGSHVSLTCSSTEIESGEDNLVYRAAMLLKRHTGSTRGAQIELEKRIPVAAGLAGGSGDAAATLVALNHLWELGLSTGQLRELALELGSDVPYCVVGGTMAATARGERLMELEPLPETWIVLLHPPLGVSTSRVYQHPKLRYSEETPVDGMTSRFREAITALESQRFVPALFNRMEEVVFAEHPQLAELKTALLDKGCQAAAMTGSGPTLFGICADRKRAERIAGEFDEVEASVVQTVNVGVERI